MDWMAAERLVLTANPLSPFWAHSEQAASTDTKSQPCRSSRVMLSHWMYKKSCKCSRERNFHQLLALKFRESFKAYSRKKIKILYIHWLKYCLFTSYLTPLTLFFLLFSAVSWHTQMLPHPWSPVPGQLLTLTAHSRGTLVWERIYQHCQELTPISQITSARVTWWRYKG